MKEFTELTDQELVALSATGKEFYLKLALADAGVDLAAMALPPQQPEQPDVVDAQPKPEEEVTVYELAGVLFTDLDEVKAVQDLIAKSTLVSSSYNRDYYVRYIQYNDSVSIPSIATKKLLRTEELAMKYERLRRLHEAAKKAYQEAMKLYSEYQDQRENCIAPIEAAIASAQLRLDQTQKLQQEWHKCIEIAEWDISIARAFFLRMYPNRDDICVETPTAIGVSTSSNN